MRSNGATVNAQLSWVISKTGHADRIVVSDAGLPTAIEVERIDLAKKQLWNRTVVFDPACNPVTELIR